MAEPVLELKGVSKVYDQGKSGPMSTRALDDVSMRVEKGEFLLIVGSSGSGKSTLLNMIGLLDRPTTGSIRIDGIETSKLDDTRLSAFRSKRLGFVFQFANLIKELSVLENVMLPGQILGDDRFDETKARKLLEAVEMGDCLQKRADSISGGQAQRAAIARGLVNEPSLVLADEPTGNLDSKTAATTISLMRKMASELGQTFVIVTHDRHQFGDVDRVVTIKDGKVYEGADV